MAASSPVCSKDTMFIHVVAFRWNEKISPEQIAVISKTLKALSQHVTEVKKYRFGPDAGVSAPTNFDFVVVAEFDSADDWKIYDTHPEHNRVRKEVLGPFIAERVAVQFAA